MGDVAGQSRNSSGALFGHDQADLCVACGLCLPACPTYHATRTENESPRGRLSLIKGLATGNLSADKVLVDHLDRCTLCLACEKACPAQVGFEQQMNQARSWLEENGKLSRTVAENALMKALGKGGKGINLLGTAARAMHRGGITKLLRGSGLLHFTGLAEAVRSMPAFADTPDLAATYPAQSANTSRVALFTGCLQHQTDPETLPAAIKLLNRLGHTVDVPRDQACCGGLHLHGGDSKTAERLAETNRHVFHDYEKITGVASGCGAVLKKYPGLGERFLDINTLLAEDPGLTGLPLSPLKKTVLVHEPCSHRNQLQQVPSVYRLLKCIPGLDIQSLPGNEFCCGGAGSYSLAQPALARQLREPKLDALIELQPAYLVTTNIGCALHLRNGLAERGIEIDVIHPVVLLARQLADRAEDGCPERQTADMV